jgi:NAD(P)-dependent dehydrogenase (short-subunit alcohol dehydrogenase family)
MSNKPVCAVVGIGPKNGAAFARRFAADGYAVALMSRKTDLSETLAAELGDAKAFSCDVSDADSIAKAFAEVRAQLGPIDTVIYNAGGGGRWGDIENVTVADFEDSWSVNSRGLFLTTKEVLPAMLEKAAGNIVVVGATASLRGKPFTTTFAPAKAAQRSLAQALARHLAPKGIHVSLMIIDGGIGDPLQEPADKPTQLDPNDIAHAAAFLASQPRSAWTFELDVRPQMENW